MIFLKPLSKHHGNTKINAGFQQIMPALKQTKNPSITDLAKYCFLSHLFIPAISQHGFFFQEGYCKFFFFGQHL